MLEKFEKVLLVTPRERLGNVEALVNRQGIYRRLYKKGIEVVVLCEPVATSRFEEGEVTLANIYTGEQRVLTDVSLFTYATPRSPNDALAAPLRAAGVDVRLIGDCFAPRFALNATQEGHKVGCSV
jgi:hypothetical protein